MGCGGFVDALEQFLIGDAFFFCPFNNRHVQSIDAEEFGLQIIGLPCIGIGFRRHIRADHVAVDFFAHRGDGFGYVRCFHHFNALLIDHLTLIVHHIIVFQQVLADFVVALLNFLLGTLNRTRHPWMEDSLILFHAEFLQQSVNAFGTENTHQVIFQR